MRLGTYNRKREHRHVAAIPFIGDNYNGEVVKIDIEDIRSGKLNDNTVFICDYRQDDLDKKPIRNVKPQEVVVCSNDELPKNKKIYYSNSHFRGKNKDGSKSSRVIPLFDNTGYREYTGVALEVFSTMEEAEDAYRNAVELVIDRLEEKKKNAVQDIEEKILRLRGSVINLWEKKSG